MKGRESEEKQLYISHMGEVLIWLIIVLIIVAITSSSYIYTQKHEENDYRIFLQDVDGLIVGSPVRMMGIEVGYVTKIKPTNKEMYVKFLITNPDIKIPQGTRVTVEFSGMAGSKSLELYPPDKNTYIDETVPVITVMPPKRLHDAFGLLHEMYKKLNSIIYSTSSFGSRLNDIKTDTGAVTPENMNNFIDFSNKFIDDTNKKTGELRTLWKRGAEHVK